MIQVERDPKQVINFEELRNVLDKAYNLANRDHLDVDQVYKKVADHDVTY